MNKNEIKKIASKYVKFVEWSDEDQVYIGRCPELFGGGVHGDEPIKVFEDLCVAVEDVLGHQIKGEKKIVNNNQKKYSGKFIVRVDPELHRAISVQAENQGISLNQYVLKKIKSSELVHA